MKLDGNEEIKKIKKYGENLISKKVILFTYRIRR
jgi:hypothetical protein